MCDWCSKPFDNRRPGEPQKFCSVECWRLNQAFDRGFGFDQFVPVSWRRG